MVAGWLAAAVLVTAGAVGAYRYVSTFWLYRGFAAPRMPRTVVVHERGGQRRVPVSPTTVQDIRVTSSALDGYRDQVYVVLPPGYASDPQHRYPVLYLLHGYPEEPDAFLTIGGVAQQEAALVAAGRMAPLILVMPTGTRSYFSDQEWVNGVRPGNRWETFVARDLVRAIDRRYRTLPDGRGRAIAGLSEGGYGALNIGVHHPGEFTVLESWSGYTMAAHMTAIFDHERALRRYNSPAVWIRRTAGQLRADGTYVWFYSGSSDWLARQNRAFSRELAGLGIGHRFFTHPGRHNWELWRALLPQALTTASQRLSRG